MKSRVLLFTGMAIVLSAFALTFFWSGSWSARTPEAIRIAMPHNALSALMYIAEDRRYFEDEGLAVTITPHPYGKEALEAMLAGNAEFAVSGSLPVSTIILDGAEPRLLTTLAKSDHSHVVVANGKRHIARPADLRGKSVGVRAGSTLQFYLDVVLIDAGVRPSEVRVVNLSSDDARDALRSGQVDAAALFAPTNVHGLGSPALDPVPFSPTLYTMHWNLVSTARVLKDRNGAAEKLLRALVTAQEFAIEHPEEAIAITARRAGIPLQDLAPHWQQYRFEVRLPQSLVVTLEDETRWANSLRDVQSPSMPSPNFLDYLDTGPLHRVRPEAVRVTQ